MIFSKPQVFFATNNSIDSSINLFSLLHLAVNFLFANFLKKLCNSFSLFVFEIKPENFTCNWAFNYIFFSLTIFFESLGFIVLSDLDFSPSLSNWNCIYQCSFDQLIRQSFNVSKYLNDSFKSNKSSLSGSILTNS